MSGKVSREALQRQLDEPPFHQFLQPELVSVDAEAGEVVMRLPFRREFQRSRQEPQIHGGVTAAFVDIAGDYALAALLGRGVPTTGMHVDFLRMASGTDLTARARVIRAGRTLGVVDIEVSDDDGKLIAVGRATYSTRSG